MRPFGWWHIFIVTFCFLLWGGPCNHLLAQTDVTGYETVTVTIPATGYNPDAGGTGLGAPQMARVKYNKQFPLVITSDDMGKTELTNNWAAFNGYPIHTERTGFPTGDDYLATPYNASYATNGSDPDNYQPMTYTDDVGGIHRFTATSAIWPQNYDNTNYTLMNATDAKTMLRTGWSFAQHDVDAATDAATIASCFAALSSTWATATGSAGLKIMVEPNGNHDYVAAGISSSEICWNIFQNATTTYPNLSLALNDWAATRSDWTASGRHAAFTTFSNKPTGANERMFFQGHETEWNNKVGTALTNNDGSKIILGGTHGIGSDVMTHLRDVVQPADKAWVASADEVWEYYYLYNNVYIDNVNFSDGKLTFQVHVPTYNKSMFRELTINIPGLTGGPASTDGTVTLSGATVVTGGYKQNASQFTINIGLESRYLTYIDELTTLYRNDPSNLFVKRDAQYLIDQLLPGDTKTAKQAALNKTFTYTYSVNATLNGAAGPAITGGSVDEAQTVSYAFPRYILSGTSLYSTAPNASPPYYVGSIDVSGESGEKTKTIAYNKEADDIVFFAEGETFSGITLPEQVAFDYSDKSKEQYFAMALTSNAYSGKLEVNKEATIATLPAGKYKITFGAFDTNYSACGPIRLYLNGVEQPTFNHTANNTLTNFTSDELTVFDDDTPVTLKITDARTAWGATFIDYAYIQRTGAVPPTVTLTASPTTGVKKGDAITLTANARLNGNTSLTSILFQYKKDDGEWTNIATVNSGLISGEDLVQTFTPESSGSYVFRATATDNASLTGTSAETAAIVVTNNISTVSLASSSGASPVVGTTVTLTATATPVSGETVTYLAIEESTDGGTSWSVVGDAYGTPPAPARAEVPRKASSADEVTGVVTVTYSFTAVAGETAEYRATAIISGSTVKSSDDVLSGGDGNVLTLTTETPAARTLTFLVYKPDGTLETAVNADAASGTTSAGTIAYDAVLATAFSSDTNLKTLMRQYCDYTFYSDAALTNAITVADGQISDNTVYVKWAYSSTAPVFSTGTDATKFQYYTIINNNSSTYQKFNSGTAFEMGSTAPNVGSTAYYWAFVGTPYNLKLYNRAGGYIATITSYSNQAAVTATSDAASAQEWELKEGNFSGSPHVFAKGTNYIWWRAAIYQNNESQSYCYQTLKHIIVPLKVYDSSMNMVDDLEYQLDYPGTNGTLAMQSLTSTSYSNPVYRHKYCTYTGYETNNDGTLEDIIPAEGVSIYGGSSQRHKAIYATFTVNGNNYLCSSIDDIYWYAFKGGAGGDRQTFATDASSISNTNYGTSNKGEEYQWALIGSSPYSVQIVSRKFGTSIFGTSNGTANNTEVLLSDDITAYPNYQWELLDPDTKDDTKIIAKQKEGTGCLQYGAGFNNGFAYIDTNSQNAITLIQLDHTQSTATLSLTSPSNSVNVDGTVTLTATATPIGSNAITYFAIEKNNGSGVYEPVGEVYGSESGARAGGPHRVNSATKDDDTGVVTITYDFTPSAAGTYEFRARAIAGGTEILSTISASALAITATLASITPASDNYTLILVDKSGNEVFSESNVPASRVSATASSGRNGDPLADKYRSPFVTHYRYYDNKTDAQNNSGSNLFGWETVSTATPTVYVGYEVDATKMAETMEHIIYSGWTSSKVFMHPVYRGKQSNSSNFQNRYNMQHQKWDQEKNDITPNEVNAGNLPFVDQVYMWSLGTDPYHVMLTNNHIDSYKYIKMAYNTTNYATDVSLQNTATNGSVFSLLYWNGDTSSEYASLRYLGDNTGDAAYRTDTNAWYLYYDGGNEGCWRLNGNPTIGDSYKFVIKTLPSLNVNVVNAAGAVEYTMKGYYVEGATVPNYTPFFLQRSYTSNHRYYYNSACKQYANPNGAINTDNFDGANIYVRYNLSSDWNTDNLFLVSDATDKHYYLLNYTANTSTPYLAVDGTKKVIGLSTSTTNEAQWALYGTPYALRIESRANSGYYVGIPENAVYNTNPQVYNSFTNIISTWELAAYTNSNITAAYKPLPVIRPQGSISREAPLLHLRPNGTNAALFDHDDNNCRVTFEDATKVQLVVVDKSGRELFSEYVALATITSTSGDPLSVGFRSPYAKNYKYYATNTEAKSNSGTALDQEALLLKAQQTVYVGYDAITADNVASGETILKMNGTAAYRIRRNTDNTQGMHAVFAPKSTNSSGESYGWRMNNQLYDAVGGNSVNYNTLPFIDRAWAWELVSDNSDPYSVKIRNKASGLYLRCANISGGGYRNIFTADAENAAVYSLLTFDVDHTYLAIYVRDFDLNQTGYFYFANNDGGEWRLRNNRNDGNNSALAYMRVEELTEPLDIHVVGPAGTAHAGEVEATIHGYRNNGVGANTVPAFVPYFLQRAYTSGQKFYYTQDAAATATSGTDITTVTDASITDSYGGDGVKDIFVSYTLDDANWIPSDTALSDAAKTANTSIIKPYYSSEAKINWYGIRTSNNDNDFLKATTTDLPAVVGRTSLDTSNPDGDAMKQSEWAFIGTPYNLQIVERHHGMDSHLGLADDASSGSTAYVYAGGTENIVTTFELLTGLNNTSGKLFLRPQGSLNAQTPYVYIGAGNVSMAAGGSQALDLTWIKETDDKALTFKLYDSEGNSMNSVISDYTYTGISAGDDLATLFSITGMKRQFCNYKFYKATTFSADDIITSADDDITENTVYVQWTYTDNAPVFSSGTDDTEFQYYVLTRNGDTHQSERLCVYENAVERRNNNPSITVDNTIYQWAFVGSPYAVKIYNRGSGMYFSTATVQANNGTIGLTSDVASAQVFDMPDTEADNLPNFRIRGTDYYWNQTQIAASTGMSACRKKLMQIIVPLIVYGTDISSPVDELEYMLDYPTSAASFIPGDAMTGTLTNGAYSGYKNKIHKHGFCTYTYYKTYNSGTPATLSDDITTAGLEYYGGSEQRVKRVYATYEVSDMFTQAWMMYKLNGSTYNCISINNDGLQTNNGYSSIETARSATVKTHHWLFKGDPYSFQIANESKGETEADALYPFGVQEIGSTNVNPFSGNDNRCFHVSNETTDEGTYKYKYNRWEIIETGSPSDDGTGSYIFYLRDAETESTYGRQYASMSDYNNAQMIVRTEFGYPQTITPAIAQYNITWTVVNSVGETMASQLVKNQYDGKVLTLADMPAALKRHFCEYTGIYTTAPTTVSNGSDSYTVSSTTPIYVQYTLDDGAPDFWTSTGVPEDNQTDYWYEIHYPAAGTNTGHIYYNGSDVGFNESNTISTIRANNSYNCYRWALIGTPYGVKFYNMQSDSYLTYDGSSVSLGETGTVFDLLDDYTGDLCAIWDEASGIYINRHGAAQANNTNGWTSCEFTNTYGLVKLTFVLHYSPNTLRYDYTNSVSKANGTEKIAITTFQKGGKKLLDVLPEKWKRTFCDYKFYWNSSMEISSTGYESDTNKVEVITADDTEGTMVYKYGHTAGADETTIAVHVTYDYQTPAPFVWSTQTDQGTHTATNLHWYYLVNHHGVGKMLYMDGAQSLRQDADLISSSLYTNNYEWCFIGDPYGFKMLCHYDPEHTFDRYYAVDGTMNALGSYNMSASDASPGKNLFEMRVGTWSDYFWMHPIYSAAMMSEEVTTTDTDNGDGTITTTLNGQYHYVNSSWASNTVNPREETTQDLGGLKGNGTANFTVRELTDIDLLEYVRYAGFVGALTSKAVLADSCLKEIYDELHSASPWQTSTTALSDSDRRLIHAAIETAGNMVQMKQGYYRIIPYMFEKGLAPAAEGTGHRYVRGYHYGTDTAGYDDTGAATGNSYYSRQEYEGTAATKAPTKALLANETEAKAEYDPASIFHFAGSDYSYTVTTQGLELEGNRLYDADSHTDYTCRYENIGSVLTQLKTSTDGSSSRHDYLSWVQNFAGNEPEAYRRMAVRNCFEMYGSTRLYLQPVGEESDNLMPLKLEMYPGKHTPEGSSTAQDYYFASIYVPYDLVLPSGDVYAYAGVRTKNDGQGSEYDWRLQCEKLSAQTIGGVTYEKGKFIPAGTPALIRATTTEGTANAAGLVTDYDYDHVNTASGFITLTIPNNAPAGITPDARNIFKGQYLEQVLSGTEGTDVPASGESVYIFGQATGNDYKTIPTDDNRTGNPALEAGFYINKNTPDGSADISKKNNFYVRHNKIYLFEKSTEAKYPDSGHYSGGGGAGARQFIALDFGETGIEERSQFGQTDPRTGVYDLQGRRVASAEEAADGSWRRKVNAGVYVVNGKKMVVHN